MQGTEKFYPLKGFEAYYEITESGRFRRKPYTNRRVNKKGEEYFNTKPCVDINGFISKAGYKVVQIHIKGIYNKRHGLHRLIAIQFIPNPNNYPIINHIDGNPLNNDISNLEWCTYSHNNQHRYDVCGYINKCRSLS